MKLSVPIRVAVALLLLAASSAHAQLFRAYLSPAGNDSNPCTLQAPCRLLPAALGAVADRGEIWLTGSANYNTSPVNIGKSVTIIAVPGAVGSVIAIGGPAVRIDTPGVSVALRNVVVAQLPGGGGTNGVEIAVADAFVQIDRSLIANLPGSGVVVSSGNLHVVDSVVRDNGGWGIDVGDGGSVSVATSNLLGNGSGGLHTNPGAGTVGARAVVNDSLISGGGYGARAVTNGSGLSRITLERSTVDRATTAVAGESTSSGFARVTLSRSMVVNNASGWEVIGANGAVVTLSNNLISENGPGVGVLTPASPL